VDERRRRCAEPPPDGLIEGIRQFNGREFFECHETLEALWISEPGQVRELYQGILQVGVGFYHVGRGNYRGAVLTLRRGIERLESFPPACQGVVVDELVRQAKVAAEALVGLGPTRVDELDPRLIPVIELRSDPE